MHLENINGCQRVVASSRPALAPPVDALSTLRVTSSEEQERPLKVPQASVYNAKCTTFKLALPPRQCARIHSPFGEMGFWNTDAQCSTKKGFREGIQPKKQVERYHSPEVQHHHSSPTAHLKVSHLFDLPYNARRGLYTILLNAFICKS